MNKRDNALRSRYEDDIGEGPPSAAASSPDDAKPKDVEELSLRRILAYALNHERHGDD